MALLQLFLFRMHKRDRSTPFRPGSRRRRLSLSASQTSSNTLVDLNNNEPLTLIVNSAEKRRKVPAFVYEIYAPFTNEDEPENDQLAVHVFGRKDMKIRSESCFTDSIEKFLSFRRSAAGANSEETSIITGVYNIPKMVPISCVYTAYPSFDVETGEQTITHCTKVEFRRRYLTLAQQTVTVEQQEVDREPPKYVSYVFWNVT